MSRTINIYELNLASFAAGASYEELAETLPAYLGKMHYTHVLLMPLLATREEASLGYLTSAYFTLSTKLGAAAGFRKLVNALHSAGIGVLMDWSCVRSAEKRVSTILTEAHSTKRTAAETRRCSASGVRRCSPSSSRISASSQTNFTLTASV